MGHREGQSSPRVGGCSRGFGEGRERPPNLPRHRGGSWGSSDALALPLGLFARGHLAGTGVVQEEAPRLGGAPPGHCPPRACAPACGTWAEKGLGRQGPREPTCGSLVRGTHPCPRARERGTWVVVGGMLGRAAGRRSYSPYSAGRRRMGTAASPKRSLDSLPHAPTVWLTVGPGTPRGVPAGRVQGRQGSCTVEGMQTGFDSLGWVLGVAPQQFGWAQGGVGVSCAKLASLSWQPHGSRLAPPLPTLVPRMASWHPAELS